MTTVLLTALGVGGATVIGALIGFIFKKISHKFVDIITAFAAGVMLCAAVVGLVIPSVDYAVELVGKIGILITVAGVFVGALVLNLTDKVVPHMHGLLGAEDENKAKLNKIMLFVFAIAIHNLPEGLAAGVGFGSGNVSQALTIAGGIALQNIPEGMVIIGPMLAVGISKKKTFFIALITGLVEVIGTLIGYFAIKISIAILPFALAFAGGTMLFVIGHDMIPETHSHGAHKGATYALLIGFIVMFVMDFFLG